jgi:hypothetical protein
LVHFNALRPESALRRSKSSTRGTAPRDVAGAT